MKDFLIWHQLTQRPFNKEIKSTHVMRTKNTSEALARLDYMKARGGIMLLTGDPGTGKSVTLRCFTESLNPNLYHPIYTPLTTLKGADLLRHINDKLGLPNRASKGVVYKQIQQEVIESREQRGKTVVLIIDEAHILKTCAFEELRLLTNFKMDSYDPFILILSGQTELRRIMEYAVMEPFVQRLAMRYHMAPLDADETKTYVEAQMKLAGAVQPLFDESAIKALHELSHGIPRKIGTLACESLTYAMFAEKKAVDADMVMAIKAGG